MYLKGKDPVVVCRVSVCTKIRSETKRVTQETLVVFRITCQILGNTDLRAVIFEL